MKYRYAFGPANQLIDIHDLPQDRRARDHGPFQCLSCSGTLIAKTKGRLRQKHFAHAADVSCSRESYLHLLGKRTFLETFQASQRTNTPLLIQIAQTKTCSRPWATLLIPPCPPVATVSQFNLLRYFDTCTLEGRDPNTGFVADLLLTHTRYLNRRLYIEIFVTHEVTQEKIDSDIRIIEIALKDEEAVAHLRGGLLDESNARFFNFTREVPLDVCTCEEVTCSAFTVDGDGRAELRAMWLGADVALEETNACYRTLVRDHPPDDPGQKVRYHQQVLTALRQGVAVKNCYACQECDMPQIVASGRVRCRLHKREYSVHHTLECPSYTPRLLTAPRFGLSFTTEHPSTRRFKVRVQLGGSGWVEPREQFDTSPEAEAFIQSQRFEHLSAYHVVDLETLQPVLSNPPDAKL